MVFDDKFGTVPTSGDINKVLRKLLDECGYRKRNFHFHSLRHSHVALLLADGVDIYAIRKRLEHSDISSTANTYAYLIDEYKKKSDERITSYLDEL
jgi:integrase